MPEVLHGLGGMLLTAQRIYLCLEPPQTSGLRATKCQRCYMVWVGCSSRHSVSTSVWSLLRPRACELPNARGVTWFGWDAPHGTAYLPLFGASSDLGPASYQMPEVLHGLGGMLLTAQRIYLCLEPPQTS